MKTSQVTPASSGGIPCASTADSTALGSGGGACLASAGAGGSISPSGTVPVTIGMAKVHLADVPRHIGRRKCDLQSRGDALLVHLIHVVRPDRHPDTLVALFVTVLLKRGGVRAAAPASLRPLTKKDASFLTRSNRAKRRRRSPIPQFLPSPLLKPRDRDGDVGHVQYRSQSLSFHSGSSITPPADREMVPSCQISISRIDHLAGGLDC